MNISEWPTTDPNHNIVEPVKKATDKYNNHPSIQAIKSHYPSKGAKFEFHHVLPEDVLKQITKLKTSKSARGNIPIKIIKLASKVNLMVLTDCINNNINENIFPNELKMADISPAFKDIDSTLKKNYRPISVLAALAKIYERILADQMNEFAKGFYQMNSVALGKGITLNMLL